jgi:hypothetical protein
MIENEVSGWINGTRNADGSTVYKTATGMWGVHIACDAIDLEICPCCARRFATARAAQLVADAVHPVPAQPS